MKPAFWTDAHLADVSDPARLFYIGLWGVADDAGWFEVDVASIGADLYPYRNRGAREKAIAGWIAVLEEHGRVVLYDCGHGHIPTLEEHQRLSSNKTYATFKKHQNGDCPVPSAEILGNPRTNTTERNGKGTVGNGKERNGSAGVKETFPPFGTRA